MYDIKPQSYFETLNKTVQKVKERLEKYISDPNEENIHSVRISIRRMVVAYRVLPRKIRQKPNTKKFVKLNKKFFKTNSKIRDFDIISRKLALSSNKIPEILNLMEVEKKVKMKLAQKQAKLASSLKFPKIEYDKISHTKLQNRFKKNSIKLIENIQILLPKVLSSDKMISELHKLRKECKNLRYLLELSDAAASSNFIIKLKQMQETLGAIHDSDITIDFLKRISTNENKFEDLLKKEIETRLQLYYKLIEMHKIPQNRILTK